MFTYDFFTKMLDLQETQIELHSIELNSIVQRINKKFRIVNNENQEINLSEIKLIPL